MEDQKYTERIRFQAPKQVADILNRQVRATGVTRGEYLRSLIIQDSKTPRTLPEKQK